MAVDVKLYLRSADGAITSTQFYKVDKVVHNLNGGLEIITYEPGDLLPRGVRRHVIVSPYGYAYAEVV